MFAIAPAIFASMVAVPAQSRPATDPRDIRTGLVIPDEGYCDQPYIVVTKDGNWLCTLTTGKGVEGERGQHVVSTLSTDKGRTWSPLVDIEPADGPEASWVMPLITPGGRVYAFYDYNGDRIDTLGSKRNIRADMLGWYVYKYSDDNGRSWSKDRYRLPVRVTACDRANDWQGKVQILWGIGKPIVTGRSMYFGFTKLGRYMLEDGEGWFFRSDNILSEPDVAKIEWQMLPDGEHGLRAPEFGSVQEEHNLVALSDGSLYCIYRTTTGHPCHAYSRDGGRTWTRPEHATYTPGGRKIKHPRACPKVWRCANGRFLLWYHNHGGKDFEGRNPAWLAGGIEKDGRIHWSQPEILLYDPDPGTRMSYPDLIEQDGRYWVSETQKTVARVHEIDRALLEGLWNQDTAKTPAARGLLLEQGPKRRRESTNAQRQQAPTEPGAQATGRRTSSAGKHPVPQAFCLQGNAQRQQAPDQVSSGGVSRKPLPRLPDLRAGGGFSLDLWVRFDELSEGQVILDSRDENGKGICLTTTADGAVRLDLCDGTTKAGWDCDPGLLKPDQDHHIVAIVDGGPKIIMFVVDGVLCDGGTARQYGWGRFASNLGNVNGSPSMRIAPSMRGELNSLRVYGRPLRVSEAVANYRGFQ